MSVQQAYADAEQVINRINLYLGQRPPSKDHADYWRTFIHAIRSQLDKLEQATVTDQER